MINGRQMTVVWRVDDPKILHKDSKEVTNLINYLESFYGEMNVSRGNKNLYLSMKLDCSTLGEVIISMKSYIDKNLDEFTKDIKTSDTTPAANHILR